MRQLPGAWRRTARGAGLLGPGDVPAPTIFAEMTALAVQTGAVNLGQGFPDEDPPAEVLAKVKSVYSGTARTFELDGVSADAWDTEGWWANVRMSNTEPLVRLNLEGKTKQIMEAKRDEFLALIRA